MKTDTKALEILKNAKWYNNWLLSFVKPYIKGDVLEIGGGIGSFSKKLHKRGNLTVIDINKNYINSLKSNYKAGFGDIETGKYFFGNRKFDTVLSFNVFEHIKSDKQAIKNTNKLIKTNGHFILLVPAHKTLYSPFDKEIGHHRRYTTKELKSKLEDAGFKEVKARYLNWLGAVGWFIFMKLFKRKSLPQSEVSIFNTLGRLFLWPEKYMEYPFGLSVLAIGRK